MLSKEENMQKIEDKDIKECSVRVRINNKDKQEFYQICQNMGMTPSKVIRKLIEEFCEGNEGKRNLLWKENMMEDDSYKNAEIKIRITEREKDRLYGTCMRCGVKPSQVLRDLIHAFCIKNKDKLNKM